MKKMFILVVVFLLLSIEAYAVSGDLTVNGMINTGATGIKFYDNTIQTTAAFPVLASGSASPGTNAYTITIPPTTGKINFTYTITPTADGEPIFIGFNDNVTAPGIYNLYAVGVYNAIAGKVHAGFARTATASGGSYNNYDIIPSGNLIIVTGDNISENNINTWSAFFKAYLKYSSPQTITKINIKCYNSGTNISNITWKVVALP